MKDSQKNNAVPKKITQAVENSSERTWCIHPESLQELVKNVYSDIFSGLGKFSGEPC